MLRRRSRSGRWWACMQAGCSHPSKWSCRLPRPRGAWGTCCTTRVRFPAPGHEPRSTAACVGRADRPLQVASCTESQDHLGPQEHLQRVLHHCISSASGPGRSQAQRRSSTCQASCPARCLPDVEMQHPPSCHEQLHLMQHASWLSEGLCAVHDFTVTDRHGKVRQPTEASCSACWRGAGVVCAFQAC